MNYQKAYWELVNSRQCLNRQKDTKKFESHHILPKCLGGPNHPINLVFLTFREHYIAHLLLLKCFDDKWARGKMVQAYYVVCRSLKKKTSRYYQESREDFLEIFKGPKGEETRQKMSAGRKGIKMPTEAIKRIVETRRKRGSYAMAATHLIDISRQNKGVPRNPEVMRKMVNTKREKGILGISDKCRQASIKARKGKPHIGRKAVYQLSKDGNIIQLFDCVTEAAKNVGTSPSNISMCCKGIFKTTKGYKWKWANEMT